MFCCLVAGVLGNIDVWHDPISATLAVGRTSSHLPVEYLYTVEFTADSMTASCPGPVEEKQAQITIAPPSCLV